MGDKGREGVDIDLHKSTVYRIKRRKRPAFEVPSIGAV